MESVKETLGEDAGEDAKETGLSCSVDFCNMGKKQGANGADGGSLASEWGAGIETPW